MPSAAPSFRSLSAEARLLWRGKILPYRSVSSVSVPLRGSTWGTTTRTRGSFATNAAAAGSASSYASFHAGSMPSRAARAGSSVMPPATVRGFAGGEKRDPNGLKNGTAHLVYPSVLLLPHRPVGLALPLLPEGDGLAQAHERSFPAGRSARMEDAGGT